MDEAVRIVGSSLQWLVRQRERRRQDSWIATVDVSVWERRILHGVRQGAVLVVGRHRLFGGYS